MPRVTIKDVAIASGYSVATVSKTLSRKGYVSVKAQKLIRETAYSMGYKVNVVAQSLSRKGVTFGVVKPKAWPQFYGQIYRGIVHEMSRLADFNVSSIMKEFEENATNEELMQIFVDLAEQVDAIIICTDISHDYLSISSFLKNRGIPFAESGNSVLSEQSDICVRVDSSCSGHLAGEYMRTMVAVDDKVAVYIANRSTPDHMEKCKGFYQEFAPSAPVCECLVCETMDVYDNAYEITDKLLSGNADLKGIYVATVNSTAVCDCIARMGLEKKIRVIVTDVQSQLKDYVENGVISATIFQNTVAQGRLTVRLLYNLVTQRRIQKREMLVTPQLVLRSNFMGYLANENGGLPPDFLDVI